MTVIAMHGGIMALGAAAPTYPVLLDFTPTVFNSDATAHAVSMPATVAAGDLLIVQFYYRGIGSLTTPSGWTLLTSFNNSANSGTATLFYKVAAGTEAGTTVNFATGASVQASSHVIRIQTGTYQAVPQFAQARASSTMQPNPPSLTPSWGSATTLWLATFQSNGSASPVTWPYANNQVNTASAGTNTCRVVACSNNITTATEDPANYVMGANTDWVAFTVAIRPV